MPDTGRGFSTLIKAAIALALAAIAIDAVVWSVACSRLDDGLRKAAAAAGWTLSAGPTRWSGWPVAAEITLPDAILRAGPDVVPPLAWAAPRAVFRLAAWHPTSLTASASGGQTITIGTAPPWPFSAQTLIATIDLTSHDPVHLVAAALEIPLPDGSLNVAAADVVVLPDGLSVNLSGLTYPGRASWSVVQPIDRLSLDGRITPPIEPQPTASASARKWHDTNGKLDLSAMSLRWGPLAANGRATLTLDQALQPAIAGQVTATGLGGAIEQLAATGAMTRSSATAAQAMLAILSAPAGGGPVTLPVTLQDGIVSIARIPLLRLAPLQWD